MWPRICATGELKLEEITAASWHRVGDHNTAIRQPYLLPLRLPETTVRIGDDAAAKVWATASPRCGRHFRSAGWRDRPACGAQVRAGHN
jgi:hypothetical protein